MFWTQNSEIDLKDIFIFYEENNLKNEDKKKILSNGLNLLDLRTHTNSFVSITNLLKNYFEVTSWRDLLNDLELATINFYIFWKVEFYKKLFLIHKVRLLNQHQEFSLDAIAKNYALKFTGGTSYWMHWSVTNKPLAHYKYGYVDLIFSWGKLDEYLYKTSNLTYSNLYNVGVVVGDYLDFIKNKNNFSQGKFKKICIFDTSHSNQRLFANTNDVTNFYIEIFKIFLKRENYKLFIKSKGNSFKKIQNNEEIKKMINLLISKNRFEIIDPVKTPSEAAKNMDLTISYDYNTAGFLAGLVGTKSIFINISRFDNFLLHNKFRKQKISFNNINEFIDFFDKKGLDEIPHFDMDTKNQIDNFQDGKSDLRVANVLTNIYKQNCI